MKRFLFLMFLTPVAALAAPATPALAGPAVDVPTVACENPGRDRARTVSSENSNMPNDAHAHHDWCHVHLPQSNPADDS